MSAADSAHANSSDTPRQQSSSDASGADIIAATRGIEIITAAGIDSAS